VCLGTGQDFPATFKYKLLVYEAGSFFASHRDTEKIPNMFATLVVNLPSAHEGGELIISHAGQSQRYSFADSSLFAPRFVAFYADCYHEVKPITSGYRLCLVYNLAIANRKKVFDMVPSDRLLFAGSHLPFPGLGHAAKDLSGYTYVPLPHAEHL